jgi:hypothetical protein
MRHHALYLVFFLAAIFLNLGVSGQVLLEAESFENKGGWVVDQQFTDQMGSPFLMAHGLGIPVKDAFTTVSFPVKGIYHLYIRTRNWAGYWSGKEAPGQFQLIINGNTLAKVFGTEGNEWNWQYGGTVELEKGKNKVSLHDLTGFNGRCDAIVFSQDPEFKPSNEFNDLAALKKTLNGTDQRVNEAGKFDLVVMPCQLPDLV